MLEEATFEHKEKQLSQMKNFNRCLFKLKQLVEEEKQKIIEKRGG
jgi:hypothetical protein